VDLGIVSTDLRSSRPLPDHHDRSQVILRFPILNRVLNSTSSQSFFSLTVSQFYLGSLTANHDIWPIKPSLCPNCTRGFEPYCESD
ncbi:hypothetical protein U1Q18_000499, partial [Sarracenia purpurea var. burkii]